MTDNILDSDSLRSSINESISNQKRSTVTVLSSLLAVQDSLHYIPDEAIEEIASFCNVTINEFGALPHSIQTLDLHHLVTKL